MTRVDKMNFETEYEQRELDMLPQTGTTTANAAVEVCPLCDVAGCRHIRERNASAATPATEEVERLRAHADAGWHLFAHWNARYLDCASDRDRIEGRLAEVEAERDDLAKSLHAEMGARDYALVRAEKAEAERDAIGAAMVEAAADECYDREDARAIRALANPSSKATLDKLIADAVQVELAAQGEPVAWAESYDGGNFFNTVSMTQTRHHTFPLYAHPSPASAPVADAELEALIERLNGPAARNIGLFREAVAAITALRARTAQPVGVTVKPLVDALSFYADASAWNQPPVRTKEGLVSIEYENQASRMQRDRGRIAREALTTAQCVSEGGE